MRSRALSLLALSFGVLAAVAPLRAHHSFAAEYDSKKPVSLKADGESLKCGECRRVYPIRDNIPIMLVDEATTDPS